MSAEAVEPELLRVGSRVRSGSARGVVREIECVPVRDALGRLARIEERVYVDWGSW